MSREYGQGKNKRNHGNGNGGNGNAEDYDADFGFLTDDRVEGNKEPVIELEPYGSKGVKKSADSTPHEAGNRNDDERDVANDSDEDSDEERFDCNFDCEKWFGHYVQPFCVCKCAQGCERGTEGLNSWCYDLNDCCRCGEYEAGRCWLCRCACCPVEVKTWINNAYDNLRLRQVAQALRAAYHRWPAFVIFTLMTAITFVAFAFFARVPEQSDGDQRELVDSVNATLFFFGVLVSLMTCCASCACYFVLYEGTALYVSDSSAVRFEEPFEEPLPGSLPARSDLD
jgi:hypothetical protein